jgi:hypothetical protein
MRLSRRTKRKDERAMRITLLHRSRTTLAAAAAVAMALAGTAIAASPAYALSGLSLVTTTTDPSSDAKTATAECPAGQVVFGATAKILDGNADVHIVNMYPNADLTKVFARGVETNGTAGDWRIMAGAICGVDGNHNLQRIEVPSPDNGTSEPVREFGAPCPDGTTLFSTGFRTENAHGNVFVEDAYPESDLAQAYYVWSENGSVNANWDAFGYAICGDPDGADMQVVSTFPPTDYLDAHTTDSPKCPTGWGVTGVGGTVQGTVGGDILIDRISVNEALTQVTSTGRESTPYSLAWNQAAFAVCISGV